MSETQEVDIEEVRSTEEYQSLQDKIVDLEDRLSDMEDRLESIEMDGREAEMMSNFGYS